MLPECRFVCECEEQLASNKHDSINVVELLVSLERADESELARVGQAR